MHVKNVSLFVFFPQPGLPWGSYCQEREIVSGSSGIRRGTGSPRRKELRLRQNRTKRIATTLEKRICCGRKRGLIFFPHPPDEKNCDYPKIARKELRLPWKNGSAAAEKGV